MAIQLRRGNKADLDTTQLKQGEPVVVLDTKEFGFKGRENEMIWGVPANRTLAGISLEKDILLSELISAGVARGASDGSGNALNALSLGGVGAANYAQMFSADVTLLNGWQAEQVYTPKTYKTGNIVTVTGNISGGLAQPDILVANLPAECAPKMRMWIPLITLGAIPITILIFEDGTISQIGQWPINDVIRFNFSFGI